MIEQTEKQKWLDKELSMDDMRDLSAIGKEDIWVIPYDVVCDKLDYLTDGRWSTKNFFFRLTMLNGNESIVGSVEVEVEYDGIKRTLTGARTLPVKFIQSWSHIELGETPNEEFAGTLLSLCIVRAVKVLGRNMGKYLNK